ncbi:Apolipoprotein N-acyltransferase [Crenothrix polyspora]|uniref:Apolipoprotein N-acyltransferase n=1 Tax=Crenothrix polyspora TaxID=360316 RepID=A0A1R4HGG1_9GAMM|nr:apolipoprotein N-acyltransferase [Crenothrix polyspora]SJM95338.1 Apolipoprotein N-acyltransferase [Crenothrix polyspora]
MKRLTFPTSKYGELLALLYGILFTLAFAPFDYPYLSIIALSCLFASWQQVTPKRAMLRAYLFGLGSFGLGVSWVYVSIHDYGYVSVTISALLTMIFVAVWALFPMLVGYLSTAVSPKSSVRLLITPALWMLIEYLRGHLFLNGFPWLLCAYPQLETPLAGYVPVFGVYGTGFIVTSTAAMIAALIIHKHRVWLFSGAIAIIWAIGFLLKSFTWTHSIGDPVNVALIQGNIEQDQKWLPENKIKTLGLYQSLTEQHWGTPIIIWPETSVPAFYSEINEAFLQPLSQSAAQQHSDVVASLPLDDNTLNEYYNAVLTLGKENRFYRKTHLLPFGEYLPWQPVSGFVLKLIGLKLGNFTPGQLNQPLLKAGGYAFTTSICYEDAFGDLAINNLQNAAYLVNVTNDAWFGHSIEPHQHMQIARMRALETGRFLLRATNTGITGIVDPKGKLIKQAQPFTTTVLTGAIIPMNGLTPYAKIGDKPILYSLLVLLFGVVIYEKYFLKQRKSQRTIY